MTEPMPAPSCGSAGTLCRGPRHRLKANNPESGEFTNILREESAPPRANATAKIVDGETAHSSGTGTADEEMPSEITVSSILALHPLHLWQQQFKAPEAGQPRNARSAGWGMPDENNSQPLAASVTAKEAGAPEIPSSDAAPCLLTSAVDLAEDSTINLPPVSAPRGTKDRAGRIAVTASFTAMQSSAAPSAPPEEPPRWEDRRRDSGPRVDAMQQEIIPQSLAATETPSAPPSPARQIIEQLRPPLSAALRAVENPELAAPLKFLKIVLTPDDLGEVEVSLKLRGGDLAIAIAASEPRTADLLSRERKLLDDLLFTIVGDKAVATVTIAYQPREAAAGVGTSENQQAHLSDSRHFRDHDPKQSFDRRESPPDKEERATRPDGRTPVHEKLSAARTGHRGGVVV